MVSITQFNSYTEKKKENLNKTLFSIRRFYQGCPFLGFKERIRQRDRFDIFHSRVFTEIGVDIEKDWHVDLISHIGV